MYIEVKMFPRVFFLLTFGVFSLYIVLGFQIIGWHCYEFVVLL